jgi:hypothetical protein
MFAALIGFLGVLVGGILSHFFAVSADWRDRRMDAMVASVTASTRVLGSHERVHDLFFGGVAPSLTDDRTVRALTERSEALIEWRIARARLEILVSDDEVLKDAIDDFNRTYAKDSSWMSAYLKEGDKFHFADVADKEEEIWKEMRAARHLIITRCQVRSRQDARWRERIRLAFSNRLYGSCTIVLLPLVAWPLRNRRVAGDGRRRSGQAPRLVLGSDRSGRSGLQGQA